MAIKTFPRTEVFFNVILTVLIIAAVLAMLHFKIPIHTILLFHIGIIYYALLTGFTSIDPDVQADYIQTGESTAAILIIVLTMRFITASLPIIIISTIVAMVVFESFLRYIVPPGQGYETLTGLLTHFVVFLIIAYMVFYDSIDNITVAKHAVTGIAHLQQAGTVTLAVMAIPAVIMLLLLKIFQADLQAFSHGQHYSSMVTARYRLIDFFVLVARTTAAAMTVLLLGLLGGIALYIILRFHDRPLSLKRLLSAVVPCQAMVVMTIFLPPWQTAFTAVVLSYLAFIIFNKKRIHHYDRYR